MTLEEARGRIGHGVIYRPTIEQGTITSVNDHWVFVRYGSDTGSKATDPALLAPLAAPAVEPLGLEGRVVPVALTPAESARVER